MKAREERIEAIFARHADAVLAYALRRVVAGNADDVVADVFAIAWRRLDDVPEDPLPWLLGCARRVIANQRRAERRRAALTDRLTRTRSPAVIAGSEPSGGLTQALLTLGERDREVLMLIAWEQLTLVQAAEVMGCSTGAFGMRLHRARQRLSAALASVDQTIENSEV